MSAQGPFLGKDTIINTTDFDMFDYKIWKLPRVKFKKHLSALGVNSVIMLHIFVYCT